MAKHTRRALYAFAGHGLDKSAALLHRLHTGAQMARKKYSDERIIKALRDCKGMVYLAAAQIGCDAGTIYDRQKTSPAVAECMKEEDAKVDDVAEMQLYKALLAGEPWAVQFRLRTKGKGRGYTEKTEVEHSGKIGRAFEDMTDDELAAELERLAKICSPSPDSGGAAGKS